MNDKIRVLVAGIGGASLGTELIKCLSLAGNYLIYGCDISPLAYGHYQGGVEQTFVVDEVNYVESILDICRRMKIDYVVPGGERPLVLLADAADSLSQDGIGFAANTADVLSACTDKWKTFELLALHGFQVPRTLIVRAEEDIARLPFPCVIKPATGSGGSAFVSLVQSPEEARVAILPIILSDRTALAQEYIPEVEGEFTVGVLSLPGHKLIGSIALRRIFHCKLSLAMRSESGLISSGYSQGLVDNFPEVCQAAESIAASIGSEGPINVQGRLKDGVLIPFEINPRFSASTYLRALAGFNEIDLYLRSVRSGEVQRPSQPKIGYYLRSLTEIYVPYSEVQS